MKVTKKLWIAQGKRHSNSIFLYDKKLTVGASGVYTGDVDKIEHYPAPALMRELNEKDLNILGVSIKPGQSIEIEISYDKPREIGWYPVIIKHCGGGERIFYWDGERFLSGCGQNIGATWEPHEYTWVGDKIENPFNKGAQR